jgi:hypothetical protein
MSQHLSIPVLAFLALALTSSASAGNTATFTDPAGDVTVVPDIVSVRATSTDPSTVTVRVEFAGPARFGGGVGFALVLDADDSRATGHGGDGVDYWFVLSRPDGSFRSERWDGTFFSPYGSTATAVVSENAVTIRFDVRELTLAGPVFRLSASTYDDTHQDEAPGLPDYFRFETRFRPVAPPVRFSPARPVAGKRFGVVRPGSATCRASIRGRALRPVRRCAWLIPKRAAGKRLTVVVRSRRYVFVVRRG